MPVINFIDPAGVSHRVEAEVGLTLMNIARNNAVPGIDGDCGGVCSCGTCQIFLTADWFELLGERSPMEDTMLKFTENFQDRSRLSCQIVMSDELDGIEVRIAPSQL